MADQSTIFILPIEIHLHILSFIHPTERQNYREALQINIDTINESRATNLVKLTPEQLKLSCSKMITEIVWRPEFNLEKARDFFKIFGDRNHKNEIEILFQETTKKSIDCRVDYCRYSDINHLKEINFSETEKKFLLQESIFSNDLKLLSNLISFKIFDGSDITKFLISERNQNIIIEFTNAQIISINEAINVEIIIEAILSNNITYLAWVNEQNNQIYQNDELLKWIITNEDFIDPELLMMITEFGVRL